MKARACTEWSLVSLVLPLLAACETEQTAHAETMSSAAPITTAVVAAVQIPEVDPCRDSPACTYHGRCRYEEEGPSEGECVADSNDDCRASLGCRDWGRCTAENEVCIATEKEDCRNSWHCTSRAAAPPSTAAAWSGATRTVAAPTVASTIGSVRRAATSA